MELKRLLNVVCLVAIVKLAFGQWSPCSRTCGTGTRSRKCISTDVPQCVTRYEDCIERACPDAQCTTYKYKSSTECCQGTTLASCGVVKMPPSVRRIFGGIKSREGEWPWQVVLRERTVVKYFCGGALVHSKWVVTAAHCFRDNNYKAADVSVRTGIIKLNGVYPVPQSSDVEEVFVHPKYTGWTNDVAVIKLKTEFKYNLYVSPICLPHKEAVDQDVTCYVAGWGAANAADSAAQRGSNDLLHVGLRVLPLAACKEAYRNGASIVGVNEDALCIGILGGGKDSCIGDSGGPLVCQRKHSCQWYLAGIVSFGARQCGLKYTPGVYADVMKFQSWIEEKMNVIKNPCDETPCRNKGICTVSGKGFICKCPVGYYGRLCDKINRCLQKPCRNNGGCRVMQNQAGFSCFCRPGYFGRLCGKKRTNACDKKPCANGGRCSLRAGNKFVCTCAKGFSGTKCETELWGVWKQCSKKCGGGIQYKVDKCPAQRVDDCPKTYKGCNTQDCPALPTCPPRHQFRYGDRSSCCQISTKQCGVVESGPNQSARVSPEKYPWMATILRRRVLACSGVLQNSYWVLTTAHCIESVPHYDITVLLGTSTIKVPARSQQRLDVEKTLLHPNYAFPNNDISLVKLSKAATLNTYVKPICPPSSECVHKDMKCIAVGYRFSTFPIPDALTENFLKELPFGICKNAFEKMNDPNWTKLDVKQQLCVGDFDGASAKFKCAPYLSGGALICQSCASCEWHLAGIVQLGPRECSISPEVHVRVHHYEKWIKQNTEIVKPEVREVWGQCSKTCGGGIQYKIEKCSSQQVSDCPKTYKGCNTHDCRPLSTCPPRHKFRYGDRSSCCQISTKECGVAESGPNQSAGVSPEKYPWMATILKGGILTCSGVLQNSYWVLATAHCTESTPLSDITILLGTSTIKVPARSQQRIGVEKVVLHPSYSFPNDDLSLVKLSKAASLNTYVKPICPPSSECVHKDMKCVAVGYRFSTFPIPDALTENFLKELPFGICKNAFKKMNDPNWTKLDVNQQLCVGDFDGATEKFKCAPYLSGGALICQSCASCEWHLAGIVQLGPTECSISPEVYIRVHHYEKWIKQNTEIVLPEWGTWQACSKTCGGGTRFKREKCNSVNFESCPKIYGGCNMQACPQLRSCPLQQQFRHGDRSSCCNRPVETCGIRDEVPGRPGHTQWVALLTSNSGIATGSLLNEQWVVTAAHYLERLDISSARVRLGSPKGKIAGSSDYGHQQYSVLQTISHEKYDYPTNDIGLVKLSQAATINSYVKPICLPSMEIVKEDTKCLAVGFEYKIGSGLPEFMTEQFVRVLPFDVCLSVYNKLKLPVATSLSSRQQLCVGEFEGVSSKFKCSPFMSGGPLICQRCSSCGWYLAGFSALGARDCSQAPEGYTNVQYHEDWIRSKISLPRKRSFRCD